MKTKFSFLNLKSYLFLPLVFSACGGILILLTTGISSLSRNDFLELREEQLREKQVNEEILVPVDEIGGISVMDYFDRSGENYVYSGGLYGVDWIPGELYDRSEIEKILNKRGFVEERMEFFSGELGGNNLYINVDLGIGDPAKNYLKSLDQYQKSGFDTIFVDFRFMREENFSQLIALFNQLSPRDKIDLGTVINPYQKAELKTSGQPFFHANQYVFLVNSYIPESLKSLVLPFHYRDGYHILGEMGSVQDTVCIFTNYVILEKQYRICTDQFIPPKMKGEENFFPDEGKEVLQEMFLQMDRYWYGKKDTQFLMTHLSQWLGI